MFKIKNKLSLPFICDVVNESNVPHRTRSHHNITETEDGNQVEKKCYEIAIN